MSFGIYRRKVRSLVLYDASGCWVSTLKPNPCGYTRFGSTGLGVAEVGERLFHRYSYRVYKGAIEAGKIICHTCNNKLCVNPNHLYQGTHKDNIRDMISAGNHNIVNQRMWIRKKLTDEEYTQIMYMFNLSRYTNVYIADLFEVTPSHIGSIIKRRKK